MKERADLVVYSPDDRIQLVVEVKNKKGADDNWAAQIRRNLLVHGMIPGSHFFLLALPEYLYLWRPSKSVQPIPPDYKVPSRQALKPYLDDTDLLDLNEHSLELLLSSWLTDIIGSLVSKDTAPELSWIFDSGLYDRIKGGSIRIETTV
jgi:hypothetical protein